MSASVGLAYRMYQWFWAGLDWLYPPSCGGCGDRGARWCSVCQRNTQVVFPPICILCGRSQTNAGTCSHCKAFPPRYTALRSWAVFAGPLRNALHRLKYQGDVSLGDALARPLIDFLVEMEWVVDVITPVPLGVARQEERGYNQAALLARPLALGCKLDYQPLALSRVRDTPSQVGLSLYQRWENVAGAFIANSNIVSGKDVLVMDDITTSGATMQACAEALSTAGARRVFGLTLARADKT